MYDPEDDHLKPPLQGYSLAGANYVAMKTNAAGMFRSDVLKMDLRLENNLLVCYESATGERVWCSEDARLRAEKDAKQARQAADLAQRNANLMQRNSDAEIARLHEEIRRLKNG